MAVTDADVARTWAAARAYAVELLGPAALSGDVHATVINVGMGPNPCVGWLGEGSCLVRLAADSPVRLAHQAAHEAVHVHSVPRHLQTLAGGVYHWRHEGLATWASGGFLGTCGDELGLAGWADLVEVVEFLLLVDDPQTVDVLDATDIRRNGYPAWLYGSALHHTIAEIDSDGFDAVIDRFVAAAGVSERRWRRLRRTARRRQSV